ncbi:MAG: hypothetical protein IJ667_00015 [Synergistaceae bacterium]|nr:hypothetical protein [Synergistaceae bacterium]
MQNYARFIRNAIAVFLCFAVMSGCQAAAKSKYASVSSASALEKALNDGDITQITITSSITGNFVIPRWIESISGSHSGITITQDKSDKPVFDAESSAKKNAARAAEWYLFWPAAVYHSITSPWTADTLTISNLTIEIYGKSCGIDVSSLSKPVYINNVTFSRKGSGASAYHGGSNVHLSGCSF